MSNDLTSSVPANSTYWWDYEQLMYILAYIYVITSFSCMLVYYCMWWDLNKGINAGIYIPLENNVNIKQTYLQNGMYSHVHKYMWAYSYYFVRNLATIFVTDSELQFWITSSYMRQICLARWPSPLKGWLNDFYVSWRRLRKCISDLKKPATEGS